MDGYLVITKTNQLAKDSGLVSSYKGLYNRVPWYRYADTGKFFDDPRMDGEYEDDESGLVLGLDKARELVERLAFIWSREELQIIYVRTPSPDSAPPDNVRSLRFIGYDVAQRYPDFFSLCANEHFDQEYGLGHYATLLNKYRLFVSADDAKAYMDTYLAKGLDEVPPQVSDLVVWETYLVSDKPE